MSVGRTWEYRPAQSGISAYWARRVDSFAAEGRGWPREAPDVPSDISRTADLLRRLEDEERAIFIVTSRGHICRLQRLASSGESGVRGAVVQLDFEPSDPHVATAPGRPPEPEEIAALLVWCAAGGATAAMVPDAWRGLHSDHPLALRMRAQLGDRCAIYQGDADLMTRITGGHVNATGFRGSRRVALLALDWQTQLSDRDWDLYGWTQGSGMAWRSVQAMVPPQPFVTRLAEGRITPTDGATVTAAIAALHSLRRNIPLTTLATIAQQLDALGLPHHLRDAVPRQIPSHNATADDYGIIAEESGLYWCHPPVTEIDPRDLAELALGSRRDVVPGVLISACKEALETEQADPLEGLYWWQLGIEMGLNKLFERVELTDVLRWADARNNTQRGTQRGGTQRGTQHAIQRTNSAGIAWCQGLLSLAEASAQDDGPLLPILATRLARAIGNNGADGASVARCLGLTSPRERTAQLSALGLELRRFPAVGFGVQVQAGPSFDRRTVDAAAAHAGGYRG